MPEEKISEEKSIFERLGGSGKGESSFIEKIASVAPWLVVVGKKDKQKTYSWHKKNLRLVIAGVVVLLFIAVIWDQSSAPSSPRNSESQNFTNPDEVIGSANAPLPSVNPNEVKSNLPPVTLPQ